METIKLKKFNTAFLSLKTINCIILGPPGCGKTSLITKDLYPRMSEKSPGIKTVINPKYMLSQSHDYGKTAIINTRLNATYLETLCDHEVSERKSYPGQQSLVVMDDCRLEKIEDSFGFRKLICDDGINTIITQQYPFFSPVTREQMDYVFLLKFRADSVKRKLYEHYGGICHDFETFSRIYDTCCSEPYRCMVIDLKSESNKLEDHIFFHKTSNNKY